ncbi:hypothetical protein FD29_GL000646 [Companilactobacillus mindensis DSM 14500]|uniref:Extracellular protein n=1 Tax=Companilactobacillus mindensis DSM 14500 TaxID=1423770 RepID=A0A0R1QFW5_9LACO|nr:hypothetical protein [Companilactobacillus mindensis]KRL43695.1 hypothetical protein FD29_GL000646 [Companilactobacillus mindensis DSM 14500]GEO77924.1 cell surface protein [Companilactobacillus mindensis]
MKKKLFISTFMLILVGLFSILSFTYTTVHSATTQKVKGSSSSSSTVLKGTVPDGIKNLNDWFNVPNLAPVGGTNNNPGKILEPGTSGNSSSQAVVLISENMVPNTVSAVWSKRSQSNEADQNYIDTTRRQTMSMWLYFGGNGSSSVYNGDGMAFVLQNVSDDTSNASDYYGNLRNGVGGETMGVLGGVTTDFKPANNTSQDLANRAIQNSWALEFDTFPNMNAGGFDSNFDTQLKKGDDHIASGFPASPYTYIDNLTNGPALRHSNLIQKPTLLTDAKWHHITITWEPANVSTNQGGSGQAYPQVKYDFDDKNMDGTPNSDVITQTVPIQEKDSSGNVISNNPFHLTGTDHKLYWGFTGSTGQVTETNLIIFESIPSITEGDLTSQLFDVTQNNREVTSGGTDQANSVNNGDELALTYNPKYVSGSKGWSNIVANITLPTNITYKNATITYGDDTTPTETIALTGDQTTIKHTLTKALGTTDPTRATLTVYGTAKSSNDTNGKPLATTSVATAHASFDGSNLYTDVMTTPFKIVQPKKITLTATDDTNQSIQIGDNVNLGGKVAYNTSTAIDPTKFQVYANINGQTSKIATSMDSIVDSSSSDTFHFPISASDLKDGDNDIIFTVEDDYHNVSNQIEYHINVLGGLLLTTANTSSFKSVNSYPTDRTIGRSDDWNVFVTDERAKDSSWTLQAQSSDLINKGDASAKWNNGGIIFVDKNGNQKSLQNSLTTIATGTKTVDGAQVFQISKQWLVNQGILLKQSSYQISGTYHGTITWTVSDGIKN